MRKNFRPGNWFQVCEGSGLNSNLVGMTVNPLGYPHAIKIGYQGRYHPFDRRTEVLLRMVDGYLFTMFKSRLDPIEPPDIERHTESGQNQ